jgi:hypothetical protein
MHQPKAAAWVVNNLAQRLDIGLPKPDIVWRYAHESPLLALVRCFSTAFSTNFKCQPLPPASAQIAD